MTDTTFFGAIQDALKGLRFGTIQLVVHEGKLVRIERMERIRIPQDNHGGPSGNTGSPEIETQS